MGLVNWPFLFFYNAGGRIVNIDGIEMNGCRFAGSIDVKCDGEEVCHSHDQAF